MAEVAQHIMQKTGCDQITALNVALFARTQFSESLPGSAHQFQNVIDHVKKEFSYLKSIKLTEFGEGAFQALYRVNDEITKALSSTGGEKWVSVEDGLPDYDVTVLVYGKRRLNSPQMGGNQPVVIMAKRQDLTNSSIRKDDRSRYQDKNQFSMMEEVTHWQPLPPSPSKPQQK